MAFSEKNIKNGRCFEDRQKFLFHSSVITLRRVQFTAIESDWKVFLTDNASKLIITGISINIEGFHIVRVTQENLSSNKLFDRIPQWFRESKVRKEHFE